MPPPPHVLQRTLADILPSSHVLLRTLEDILPSLHVLPRTLADILPSSHILQRTLGDMPPAPHIPQRTLADILLPSHILQRTLADIRQSWHILHGTLGDMPRSEIGFHFRQANNNSCRFTTIRVSSAIFNRLKHSVGREDAFSDCESTLSPVRVLIPAGASIVSPVRMLYLTEA